MARFAPFTVLPGSEFSATLSGDGDADLYLRFGEGPTLELHDCRPYADDSDEVCELLVPDDQTQVYLAVRGRTRSSFRVDLAWLAPLQ